MTYSVHIEQFDGPLSVLLQFIEDKQLEISQISLVAVTDPFVAYVRAHEGDLSPEELADFLVVASKLIYLKSRTLIPWLQDTILDEEPNLEVQLRLYQIYAKAAQQLGDHILKGRRSFSREKRIYHISGVFLPPSGLTMEVITSHYLSVLRRLEPILHLPRVAAERVVSLEEKMEALCRHITHAAKSSFHCFLAEARNREEMVVSFLALLELLKQKTLHVNQKILFCDIQIEKSSV